MPGKVVPRLGQTGGPKPSKRGGDTSTGCGGAGSAPTVLAWSVPSLRRAVWVWILLFGSVMTQAKHSDDNRNSAVRGAGLRALVMHDQRLAGALQRAAAFSLICWPLITVSRLADGIGWYALIGVLAIAAPPPGPSCAALMVCYGFVAVPFYSVLKRRCARSRPSVAMRRARVLDEFSFPSGHTMHACGFGLLISSFYPAWTWLVVCGIGLIAASRVVLGLHYPTDVAGGAVIGVSLAALVLRTYQLFIQ